MVNEDIVQTIRIYKGIEIEIKSSMGIWLDGLYNACDLVMILNSPAKLQFKPGSYGPLALSCGPKDLYLHVVKSRVSSDMIVELTDDLEHARIVDRVSQPIRTI